jgi:peptidoglycan/LPS O-acetylase OafA/YrhL
MYFENPVLRAIPFFLLGSTLASRKTLNVGFHVQPWIWRIWPILIICVSLIFQEISEFRIFLYFSEMLVFLLIFSYFRGVNLQGRERVYAKFLGSRSYVIYAVHAPIISCIGSWLQPTLFQDKVLFFTLSILLTLLVSEFVYRRIELPVLDYLSQKRH